MTRPQVITVAVVVSLALHAGLLVLAPGLRLRLPVQRETLVEVEVAPPEPAPAPEPTPAPEPLPAPEPVASPPPPARPTPLSPAAALRLDQALALRGPATAPPPAAPPPLRLPHRELALPGADTIAWTPPAPPAPAPVALASRFQPRSELPPGPDQEAVGRAAEALLRELAAPPEQPATPLVAPPQLEIEGPVGRDRKVVVKPPPPQVAIRHSADVRLKFFVSPRGEVVRAFPVARGDAALDQAALAYIKQFRFSPLPHGEQDEQWGTLRVRFRLE